MSRIQELTDTDIESLINCPKVIREDKFQKIKFVEKDGHRKFDLDVESQVGDCAFELFCRQAIDDPMDFSVGLIVNFQDGSNMRLMRCNGLHGGHRNKLERNRVTGKHIHIATERYIRNGFDAEGFAEAINDDYDNIESAFYCLISKCNINIEGTNIFQF